MSSRKSEKCLYKFPLYRSRLYVSSLPSLWMWNCYVFFSSLSRTTMQTFNADALHITYTKTNIWRCSPHSHESILCRPISFYGILWWYAYVCLHEWGCMYVWRLNSQMGDIETNVLACYRSQSKYRVQNHATNEYRFMPYDVSVFRVFDRWWACRFPLMYACIKRCVCD